MMSSPFSIAAIAVFATSVANAAEQSSAAVGPLLGAPTSLQALAEQAAAASSSTPNVAAVTRSGYADITISGAIKSNVPPARSRQLLCYVYFSPQGSVYLPPRYTILPAVISGNNFACTGKIYYKWTVLPTDHLIGAGTVIGVDTSIAGSDTLLLGYYSSGISFAFTPTASFPANGAVTKLTATEVNF